MAYDVIHGRIDGYEDVAAFLDTLGRLDAHAAPDVRDLFSADRDLIVTRAPGRLDVMGGIADYSGSLVLQLPIREATLVALQGDPVPRLRIVSLQSDPALPPLTFEMALADFEDEQGPVDYVRARTYFAQDPDRHWAAYVAGAYLVLARECGLRFREGARMLIGSRVPAGKGVSSSASLEVASMQAIIASAGVSLAPRELARLAQMVENLIVGAPCGIMDQMTASCGEASRLLALRCQPAELEPSVMLPEDLAIWGIDSGVRHAVSGSDYSSVRIGAFMGYRIIAELAGLSVASSCEPGRVSIADPHWHGYLANIRPTEFWTRFAPHLPPRVLGADFLARYRGTTDAVTTIDPGREYAVLLPTAHPIEERFRVELFATLLSAPPLTPTDRGPLLGELMYQSHLSYSRCGLGADETDRLLELVHQAGPAAGLYGARITGGGSGGTVAVLGRPEAASRVREIAERYAMETGHPPVVFSGSSPGAAHFGHVRVRRRTAVVAPGVGES
jgi:galactokinase